MQRLQVGVAIAPMYGQVASADRHVVRSVDDEVLVAVLDGIGHGEEAVRAAMLAYWSGNVDGLPVAGKWWGCGRFK
jgi:hypothetical protein